MKNKSMSQEDEMLGDRAVNFEAGSHRFSLRLHRNVRLQHAATHENPTVDNQSTVEIGVFKVPRLS